MYIITKHKDYYDSAGGVDKTCVWTRTPEIEENKEKKTNLIKFFEGPKVGWVSGPYSKYEPRFHGAGKSPYLIRPFIIGFCGKTYVGYVFKWYTNDYLEEKVKIVYGPDEFFELCKISAIKSLEKPKKEATKLYFDKFHNKPHTELFFKYRTPIWVFDTGCYLVDYKFDTKFNILQDDFIINPNLSAYRFFQVFSAPQTFQEIQMYLQGVLGGVEKDVIIISDENKLLQHGFDKKWSFRNPCPPKRKSGKCKI